MRRAAKSWELKSPKPTARFPVNLLWQPQSFRKFSIFNTVALELVKMTYMHVWERIPGAPQPLSSQKPQAQRNFPNQLLCLISESPLDFIFLSHTALYIL